MRCLGTPQISNRIYVGYPLSSLPNPLKKALSSPEKDDFETAPLKVHNPQFRLGVECRPKEIVSLAGTNKMPRTLSYWRPVMGIRLILVHYELRPTGQSGRKAQALEPFVASDLLSSKSDVTCIYTFMFRVNRIYIK